MVKKDIGALLSKQYPAGTVLFEENEPGARMYIIRSGRVQIFRRIQDKEVILAVLGPGEFFGEMAILENLPRSASARLMEESVLIELEAETFQKLIRQNEEVALRIMRKLASRVRDLDLRVQRLLVDSGIGRTIEILRWLLPKGVDEGAYIRLPASTVHVNIAAQPGVTPAQVVEILARLKHANVVKEDGADVLIAADETLKAFSTYLDMRHKYDVPYAPATDEGTGERVGTLNAMEKLLEALRVSPDELKESQVPLARQYMLYINYKQRFEKE
jgi:CRP/FNR family transcriptional regulator, cyclic AMP receptor protein